MDEENSALFPFGWGLSYTRFSYAQPTVSRAELPLREVLAAGHKPAGYGQRGCEKHRQRRRNRSRSALHSQHRGQRRAAGARAEGLCPRHARPRRDKARRFPLGFDELNFYNADVKRTVEPTTYKIWVGGSSLATAETSLKVVE